MGGLGEFIPHIPVTPHTKYPRVIVTWMTATSWRKHRRRRRRKISDVIHSRHTYGTIANNRRIEDVSMRWRHWSRDYIDDVIVDVIGDVIGDVIQSGKCLSLKEDFHTTPELTSFQRYLNEKQDTVWLVPRKESKFKEVPY